MAMPELQPLNTPYSANPVPEVLSDMLIELVDVENSPGIYGRLPPGTPYPDQQKFPGYIFLTQKTVSHNRVQRYWNTPAYYNEDVFNYDQDYVSDGADYPIYIRRYKTRRDLYTVLPRGATGTLSGVWLIRVDNPGTGYDPSDPPAVTIVGPGSGCTAVSLVNPDGTIQWIRITAEGTGYTAAPLVTIAAPPAGVQATATATIQATSCVLISQKSQAFPEDDPRFSLFVLETRLYQTFPGPTLTKWEYQNRIRQLVRIDKQLVLKSTVPADPNAVAQSAGVTVEYQDLTEVYSAKITTTIPTDFTWDNGGSANDFIYEGFVNHRFPDEIRGQAGGDDRDPTIIVAATLNSGGPSFAVDYGWDCKVTEGYAGPCRAVIKERYTFDPTNAAFIADLPTPTSVFPKAQTIYVATNAAVGDGATARVATFPIPLTLHPALEITTDPPSPTGTYAFPNNVPATVPTGFNAGDTMVLVSEPQEMGVGDLWMVRIVTIYHPARS